MYNISTLVDVTSKDDVSTLINNGWVINTTYEVNNNGTPISHYTLLRNYTSSVLPLINDKID